MSKGHQIIAQDTNSLGHLYVREADSIHFILTFNGRKEIAKTFPEFVFSQRLVQVHKSITQIVIWDFI